MKTAYSSVIYTCLLLSQGTSWAAEFASCPTQAFIIQTPSSVPISYGVELATGSYVILSNDMNRLKAYNGVGFNYHDNYIYGWDYESSTLGKTGDDYIITPLNVTKDSSAAAAGNFFVGDIAIDENVWYGYKKTKAYLKSLSMTLITIQCHWCQEAQVMRPIR
ncbi:hypothetical protein [Shewanella atlantica]|uniref:hypothetical protein n=1 Tax=Shewanella atlantica TaxID=271099 RepID=UPI001FE3205C|nr:hypothetical protein [Shewanella atlantica]